MKLAQIAAALGCKLEGDPDTEISGIATIESARKGDLSFLVNPKYYPQLKSTQASALIVGQDFPPAHLPLLRHQNPYLAFARAIEIFHKVKIPRPGIHPTALIADSARIGKDVFVGPRAIIGERAVIGDRARIEAGCIVHDDVVIGEDTWLHSGCVIRERVRIGKRCIIQSHAVIGSDGFGYAKRDDGSWHKILQVGTVILEDDVEIGAATTIDRAALGETRIGRGTKIDNLVQIGHGSHIATNCLICAQVGLAGSTKVGNSVILAGQVGAAGHLTIGDGVVATAQTGIPNSVEPGKIISGYPAIDNKAWLRSSAIFARLPELQKAIRALQRRLDELEASLQERLK
jgi:UDP-3-O-[3-hydroxymyristoyl] glucosamine N-acyltransferase